MGSNENDIEAAIQSKGLTAPRMTPHQIDATIVDEVYWNPEGTSLTVCVLHLKNGFTVTGESAAASIANFDPDLGKEIARKNAREKIWQLEGYLLRQSLHEMTGGADLSTTSAALDTAAMLAHEINRVWCQMTGDFSQPAWVDAPDWQQDSAKNGVAFHMSNPNAGDSASHDSWMSEKLDNGWVYGEVKDPNAKTHPCIVPFDELPAEQQVKDALFRSTVHAVLGGDF